MRRVPRQQPEANRERRHSNARRGVHAVSASRAEQAAVPPLNLGLARWIGFKTIIIREYGRIVRIWGQTLV